MSDLTALSDLKAAFANFDELTHLLSQMVLQLGEITKFNKDAAGDDVYGKQYSQTVDGPTGDLVSLINEIYNMVTLSGQAGQQASDLYKAADGQGASLVN